MLKVTNVTKKVGKLTAVNNLSFDVSRGQMFCIAGPNGAGESPSLIPGLNSFEGDISFKNQNISGLQVDHAIRIDGLRGSHSIIESR